MVAVGILLGLAVLAPGAAQGNPGTVRVEVRVWQDVGDELDIYVSARPSTGSWRTLGTIPLPLDDGVSSTGQYRYGDIALEVPLANRASPAIVEVRVWQDVRDSARIYISARPADGFWRTLGTIRLLLDDGLSSSGYRFGDISLDVQLLPEQVATLAGWPGIWGYRDGRGDGARLGRADDRAALGLTVAGDGSVIVADRWNHAIRRVAADGTVTTIAGSRGAGLQDGPAESARLHLPADVAAAPDGAMYVADAGNHLVRKITPAGMVTTVAGSGRSGAAADEVRDGPAEQVAFEQLVGLTLDPYGDLYILERYAVRRLSPSGWVSTVAGGNGPGSRDGPGRQAQFLELRDIGIDDAGSLYVIDSYDGVSPVSPGAAIRKIDTDGVVTTVYRDERFPALGGTLALPSGLAVTGDGDVYIANTGRNQIVKLRDEGSLVAVAGTGEAGNVDGTRRMATFSLPRRMAFAPDGSLVVADHMDSVIRRILPAEGGLGGDVIPLADFEPLPRVVGARVTVFAGSGDQGLVDGPARQARLLFPNGMALDHSGNVIVADAGNHAIRVIDPDGILTTLAGGNDWGMRDGSCEEAQFFSPRGVAVHADGSIYVADSHGDRIRRISTECSVTTVIDGPDFQGGPGAAARAFQPNSLAFDDEDNLLIAGALVWRLSPDGQTSTVAGAPRSLGRLDGYGGASRVFSPWGIAVDDEGVVFFTEDRAIRMVDHDGFVSTLVRTVSTSYGGALSPFLKGIAVGPQGELYVADTGHGRVLRVTRGGALAIVMDGEHAVDWRGLGPSGILVMPDGSLLVGDIVTSVIWKVTFEDEQDEKAP